MEPGTALAIIQLSASVLKLGRDIALEFVGPEGAIRKLRHLNTRLQILNTFLEEVLDQPGSPDKLSTTQFPGSESIAKTLRECKSFLEHYKSLLTETPGRGATARRVLLTVGPDASRIDEFHKKIDQHYAELEQWRLGGLSDRVQELQLLVTSVRDSLSIPTNHLSHCPTPNPGHVTPDNGCDANIAMLAGPPLGQQLPPATIQNPPVLRPQSRTPSLNSLPELPPAAITPNHPCAIDRRPQYSRHSPTTESGRVTGGIDRRSKDISAEAHPASSSSLSGPISGHYVTLIFASGEVFRFSHDAYEVYESETGRVIEWYSSQIRVRHFLPPGIRGIPYTTPNDPKMEITFLPHDSKHYFHITRPSGSETRNESIRYQFTHKTDREEMQRRARMRQLLQMIQVVRIHRWKGENIAMNVHLKVWAGNEQGTDPTFSFASLTETEPTKHTVEYTIRWFKREPERIKGGKRLILRPYLEDTDLNYGPSISEKPSAFKDFKRKMSIGSNASSIDSPHTLLYEGKGVTAPDQVQRLGYLDIEFENPGLREKFIIECFKADNLTHMLRRTPGSSEVDQPSPRQASVFSPGLTTASQRTTPQPSISEVEGSPVGLGVDTNTPASPYPLQLPSPAISRTAPRIQFENLSVFTMPDAAIPAVGEVEPSEPSPTDTQAQREPGG